MKITDVLTSMKLEFVLRGNRDYTPDLDLASLDIECQNLPTNEEFHAAALLAEKQLNKDEYSNALQGIIETEANEKNYNDSASAASYVNSSNAKWKAEADAFVAWRDNVWLYAFDVYTRVEAGEIPLPALEDFVANAPTMEWPQ